MWSAYKFHMNCKLIFMFQTVISYDWSLHELHMNFIRTQQDIQCIPLFHDLKFHTNYNTATKWISYNFHINSISNEYELHMKYTLNYCEFHIKFLLQVICVKFIWLNPQIRQNYEMDWCHGDAYRTNEFWTSCNACGFIWSVEIPITFQRPLKVPCPALMVGKLSAIRAVQGDCETVYKYPCQKSFTLWYALSYSTSRELCTSSICCALVFTDLTHILQD